MNAGFEIREHTADIIVRAWAPSLAELFEQCTRGLYAVIGELVWLPGEPITLKLAADTTEELLRDYLAELLFIFETGHEVVDARTYVQLTDTTLELVGHRCPIDPARSRLDREVKAVTYHGMTIQRGPTLSVECILDI